MSWVVICKDILLVFLKRDSEWYCSCWVFEVLKWLTFFPLQSYVVSEDPNSDLPWWFWTSFIQLHSFKHCFSHLFIYLAPEETSSSLEIEQWFLQSWWNIQNPCLYILKATTVSQVECLLFHQENGKSAYTMAT